MSEWSGSPSVADDALRSRYDWSSTAPSTAVVEALAEATGSDPMEVDPMYESLDPDALDALFESARTAEGPTNVTVFFRFGGRELAVHGDGEVVVRPPDEAPPE